MRTVSDCQEFYLSPDAVMRPMAENFIRSGIRPASVLNSIVFFIALAALQFCTRMRGRMHGL